MLSEYAVNPAAIGADWSTFKDLIDRFGADKGRLVSRLPKRWEKKSHSSCEGIRRSRCSYEEHRRTSARCEIQGRAL